MERHFLLDVVYDSIDCVCDEYPLFGFVKNDRGVALIWYHDDSTDSLWEMFVSKEKRNEYFKYVEQEFYLKYRKKLNTIFRSFAVQFKDQLCTTIILEW